MKKWVLGFCLLFVLACTIEPAVVPPIQELEIGEPEIVEVLPEPVPEPIVIAPEPVIETPTESEEFIARIQKVKNYEYSDTIGKVRVDVANDILLIKYFLNFQHEGRYFDHALIDRKSGTVKAWCVGNICDVKEKDFAYTLPYLDHFKITTPIDVLNSIKAITVHTDQSRLLQDNEVYNAKIYDQNDVEGEMYLHSFYAFPLEYSLDITNKQYHEAKINPALWEPLTVPEKYELREG